MQKFPRQTNPQRRGSVYLAVLGTAMIVSVLALSSLALQRVQNRMLTSSVDVRQAQHHAETAIELGLLAIKNDPNWRTNYSNGSWFANRSLGDGSCSLTVTDPDGNLADDPSDAIVMTGVGVSESSEQRIVRTFDAFPQPLGCLSSSAALGDALAISGGAILRASNSGMITANSASVSSSNVYGRVRAVTVSGGNYNGSSTQITDAERPAMPDWSTVFDYYRNNGTEISINSLLTSPPNLVRNGTMSSTVNGVIADWIGDPPGTTEDASVSQTGLVYNVLGGGNSSLQVNNRDTWYTGAVQRIESVVKPGQAYYVEAWVRFNFVIGQPTGSRNYGITCYTKGTGNGSPLVDGGSSWPNQSPSVPLMSWRKISATVTAPAWSGDLEYAFIKFAGSDAGNTGDFYLDDVVIREVGTGRYIYKQVIGPNVNPFGGSPNAEGIYWINCGGNKIVIERSRIRGTLLLVNPGAGSMVTGPIHWSPAKPGYPALLVDADTASNADFTIAATNRTLSESEDVFNYNPAGAAHPTFGTDSDTNDTYPSEIQGLVVVEDDVTFQNNSLIRGSIIAGGDLTSNSGALEVIYQPDALYSPPPGFTGTWKTVTRPLSARKVVGP